MLQLYIKYMIKSVNFMLWEVHKLFERKLVCLTRPENCKIYIATLCSCRFFLFFLYFSENVIFYLVCCCELIRD